MAGLCFGQHLLATLPGKLQIHYLSHAGSFSFGFLITDPSSFRSLRAPVRASFTSASMHSAPWSDLQVTLKPPAVPDAHGFCPVPRPWRTDGVSKARPPNHRRGSGTP